MMRQSSEPCTGFAVVCPTISPMNRLSAWLSDMSSWLFIRYQ